MSGGTKKYCISEVNVAKTLLKAANFNKDSVHTQCILFKNVGHVFAAEVCVCVCVCLCVFVCVCVYVCLFLFTIKASPD